MRDEPCWHSRWIQQLRIEFWFHFYILKFAMVVIEKRAAFVLTTRNSVIKN